MSYTVQYNIPIAKKIDDKIQILIKQGFYVSKSEAVRSALMLLIEKMRKEEKVFEKNLMEAVNDLGNKKMEKFISADQIFHEIKQ